MTIPSRAQTAKGKRTPDGIVIKSAISAPKDKYRMDSISPRCFVMPIRLIHNSKARKDA